MGWLTKLQKLKLEIRGEHCRDIIKNYVGMLWTELDPSPSSFFEADSSVIIYGDSALEEVMKEAGRTAHV